VVAFRSVILGAVPTLLAIGRGALRALPICLLLVGLSHAQPPASLDLSFGGDAYLGDPSRGLDARTDYRQHFLTIRIGDGDDESDAIPEYEWINEIVSSGDRHAAESYAAMGMSRDSYLLSGEATLIGRFQGQEPACLALPEFMDIPPTITVADSTGFHGATLLAESEEINGVAAAKYRLDPPTYSPRFEEGSLGGELWLALNGGHIVRYWIEGRQQGETVRWEYDLTEITEVTAPDCGPAT
jgi:hypothetical protein